MKTALKLFVVLLLGVVTSSVTLADTIKREVTFSSPVVVNGTEIKKGTYVVKFDDQTNEITISRGKKVLAKAPVRLEKRNGGENALAVYREVDGKNWLQMVYFKNHQATILSDETKATIAR
jgi:Cu/Ag efflux protein CusF